MMRKNIPNAITCLNLISGCIAAVLALQGHLDIALIFVLLGCAYDFLDGMAARLLDVSSPLGKELDSLADCITFGFVPSVMIYEYLGNLEYPSWLELVAGYIPFIAFLVAAFSALRLAKFNIDDRQTYSFIGLPTPANALFWAAFTVGAEKVWTTNEYSFMVVIIMEMLMCYLLVSEIPMFSLKFKTLKISDNKLRLAFLLSSIPLFSFGVFGVVIIITWYIALSIASMNK